MCKDNTFFANKQADASDSNHAILDKLAQLGTNPKKALLSKAKAKLFSYRLSIGLSNVDDTVLKSAYVRTFFCNKVLTVVSGKIVGSYCNGRWCSVCNRIRMAKMINGYKKPLESLIDPYFVTLTVPNCLDFELRGTIESMISGFQSVCSVMKKRRQRGIKKYQVVGVRKLECTVNFKTYLFHPHFHLIVEGRDAAEDLRDLWLKKFPGANIKAQDIRPAQAGSLLEIFKYTVKSVFKTSSGTYSTDLKALDVIYTAMLGLRTFQPIGIERVDEDISGIISQLFENVFQFR